MDLVALLIRHEALRLWPYRDSVGKLTIGVGRNLDDRGIRESEARIMLANDIADAKDSLKRLAWFDGLDEVRQAALIDLCFNVGFTRLLTFQRTLDALAQRDFLRAAKEMLQSRWAAQVRRRATELAEMIRTGEWPDDAPN